MPYKFGDVVLVRFPFTNQATFKQRPAVVVSSDAYNNIKPDVIVMAITSQIRTPFGLGEISVVHWQEANLLKSSAIKPLFATLEHSLIIRKLGELEATDRAALAENIERVLG